MLIALTLALVVTIIIFIFARKNAVRREDFNAALRTKAILGTVVGGIITINTKGAIESFNPSAERVFGYDEDEVIGKNVNILMPEPYYSKHDNYLKQHLNTGEKKIIGIGREVEAKRKDGSIFPVELGVSSFEIGGKKTFVGSIQDITEKKQLTANLDGQMKAINKVQAVIEFNLDGTIITANENFLKMMGYTLEEIQGKNHNIFEEQSELENKKYSDFWEDLLRGEYKAAEYKRISKNGTEVWIQGSYNPIFNEQGKPYKIVKFATNITDRKAAEYKLAKYADDLKWKTEALESAKEEAERANNLKSEFLANMSHEIRTPMNGIIGMTELMLNTNLTSKQEAYAVKVMNSAENLLRIINDILDFSKIEAGKLELEPTPFNLHNLCEDIAELFSLKTREKSMELIMRYSPYIPENVIGDSGRIRQIITNYLSNALKFTKEGRIVLNIDEVKDNNIGKDKVKFKISISDTGIGIPEKYKSKLFEKFTQADSSTTRKFGGTGLGLAICRQLSEVMEGQAGFESEDGKGSTFWATIVLEKDKGTQILEPMFSNLEGIKVLVIDDIELNQQLLFEQLTAAKMKCDKCFGSKEALLLMSEAFKEGQPYDLVLIDDFMPEMNGKELAEKICNNSQFNNSYLIILSSAASNHQNDSLKIAGFSGYISKPIRRTHMLETLSKIITKKESNDKNFFLTTEDLIHSNKKENISIINLKSRKNNFKDKNILLVEDNPVNLDLAIEMVAKLGLTADIARNGLEAIEQSKNQKFDLILMDVNMPHMDGYKATQKIREIEKAKGIKHIPIIALTANAMKGDDDKCKAAGMDDYLSKPVHKNDLESMLYKWLG